MSQKSQETRSFSYSENQNKNILQKIFKALSNKTMDYSPCNFFLFCSVLVISKCCENGTCILKTFFFSFRESLIITIKYQCLLVKDLLYLHPRHKNAWNCFFSECYFYWIWNFLSVFCFYLIAFVILQAFYPVAYFSLLLFVLCIRKDFLFKMLSLNLIQGFFLFTL